MTPIAPLITNFLREHMPIEKGRSPYTCETYAYAFRRRPTQAYRKDTYLREPVPRRRRKHTSRRRRFSWRAKSLRLTGPPEEKVAENTTMFVAFGAHFLPDQDAEEERQEGRLRLEEMPLPANGESITVRNRAPRRLDWARTGGI